MTTSPEPDRIVRELFDTRWHRAVHLATFLGAADPEAVAGEACARLYARTDARSATRARRPDTCTARW